MTYQDIITIEPGNAAVGRRFAERRITVADVLGWLAAGMTYGQIISEYPELTEAHIRACLAYAADRERRLVTTAKMKLLQDQNLSFKLCGPLSELFPGTTQVRLVGFTFH